MGSPNEKPNFLNLAKKIAGQPAESVAITLSDMYESGYHVGLVYGGWYSQDADENWQREIDSLEAAESFDMHDPVEDMMNYGGSGDED